MSKSESRLSLVISAFLCLSLMILSANESYFLSVLNIKTGLKLNNSNLSKITPKNSLKIQYLSDCSVCPLSFKLSTILQIFS
ncbi:unnamed protein product [Moneuplotes crassus]|uniref:Uncharacterized protein n=1 Tax=Euplotes crassus TaxID=5936 RepID=A0AAD1XZ99_EUPCR|nr:unnamed protein product [Moneuplotes crassus]